MLTAEAPSIQASILLLEVPLPTPSIHTLLMTPKGFTISTQFKKLQSIFARKFPLFMLIQTLNKRTELISECPTDNISVNQS